MRKLIRYTVWHKGRRIEGIGNNPLAARNHAMQQIRDIAPDDPRVQYLDKIVKEKR